MNSNCYTACIMFLKNTNSIFSLYTMDLHFYCYKILLDVHNTQLIYKLHIVHRWLTIFLMQNEKEIN